MLVALYAQFNLKAPTAVRRKSQIPGVIINVNRHNERSRLVRCGRLLFEGHYPQIVTAKTRHAFIVSAIMRFYLPKSKRPQRIADKDFDKREVVLLGKRCIFLKRVRFIINLIYIIMRVFCARTMCGRALCARTMCGRTLRGCAFRLMVKVEQFFDNKNTFKSGRNIQPFFDGKIDKLAGTEAFKIGKGQFSQWLYL